MMSLNRAMIIGNLTRDPDSRTTPDGTSVCSFTVATNMVWNDAGGNRQERAEFHNVVAWRKLADICTQYLRKGNRVYVEGRLQTRSWDDQSGVKRYRTEIIAENVIMLDRPGQQPAAQTPAAPAATPPSPPNQEGRAPEGGSSEEEINIEEIPF